MNKVDRIFSYFSSNLILFITCAGIWGSTWIAIKFQLKTYDSSNPDPVISVLYRFIISALLMFSFALYFKMKLTYSRKHHLIFFLQGACNFSINYILTYWAEQYAPSAIIATAFTLLVIYNIFGMKLFFRKKIGSNVYWGALLGIIGIFFIFGHELKSFRAGETDLRGLGLGLISTFFASAGNMLSYKNYLNEIPVTISNAWGMFYGAITTLILSLFLSKEITFSNASGYWISLIYLSIFGTAIAFGAYLTLVGRIGAERASYTSILSPVIAIILSSIFEDLKISVYIFIGLMLCLLGNFVTLKSRT